ncbi:MAG: TetR/AcrR family transcriptional regulator [Desulfobacterales bacterium]
MSNRDQTRNGKNIRIIEAAARVFAQKGYAGASVADIAVSAAIGKGTVYEYFDSKEELFFAVFEWYMLSTGRQASVSISALGGSAAERLMALSESIMGLWDEIKDAFTLTMEFWAASASSQMHDRLKPAFRELYGGFRGIIISLIREGIERGEFRPDVRTESIAAALVGTWDALFLQAWFEENFDPVITARDFLEIVIKGLSK